MIGTATSTATAILPIPTPASPQSAADLWEASGAVHTGYLDHAQSVADWYALEAQIEGIEIILGPLSAELVGSGLTTKSLDLCRFMDACMEYPIDARFGWSNWLGRPVGG